MRSRVIVVFLALLQLWSVVASYELPTAAAATSASAEQTHAVTHPPLADAGSVNDHHLDDQPAQSQGETAADLSALVTQHATTVGPAQTATDSWPWYAGTLPAPALDGLRRPPRTARAVA